MNEYLKNRLSRIHDNLYLSLTVIDYALSNDHISIGLAHELSRLLTQMDRGSRKKKKQKKTEAEAYRQVEESDTHD